MSEYIPFEIQVEIMKKLHVKSLIQFQSVAKSWKSLIQSSDFVAGYSGHQQRLLVTYYDDYSVEKYVSIVDDDNISQQRVSVHVPLLDNMRIDSSVIGSSHGLWCLYNRYHSSDPFMPGGGMAVIWNPSIRKAVAVVVPCVAIGPIYRTVVGFGVCRETTDPKIVRITQGDYDMESVVEIFTLSTRAWRRLCNNLPRKSIRIEFHQVVIDGVLFWLAVDRIARGGGGFRSNNLVISFDMTSEEFREINLPKSLARKPNAQLSVSTIRGSLVMLAHDENVVWMMENGVSQSFTKLFGVSVNTPCGSAMGFRKSGEPIIEILEDGRKTYKLVVNEPYSKHKDDGRIGGIKSAVFVYPYTETLLLLDQPNLTAYDGTEMLRLPKSVALGTKS